MATETTDIAVIGGGMMGTALALGLVRQGLDVTILDEGDQAFRAARGNFGLVWVQSKGLGAPRYAWLTRESARQWPDFAAGLEEETGVTVHFEQRGGVSLLLPEDDLAAKRAAMAELGDSIEPRVPYEIVDGDEARRRLPCLGPDVAAACFSPADGHVNPLFLLRAMQLAFRAGGGTLRSDSPVTAISRGDGGTFVVERGASRLEAARIVVAAGLGTTRLAAMVGVDVEVMPRRGQVLVTARLPRFLDIPSLTVRQTDNGSVMIGESWEDAGLDDRTTPAVLAALSRRVIRLIPRLERAPVVRSWGALRILTRDGLPVYQESRAQPGAFVITCHSGVTLAALHARALAADIAAGKLSPAFDSFGTDRFDVH